MTPEQRRRLSKFLSFHLRHRPDKLGLELRPGGWVSIEELIQASQNVGTRLTLEQLREVVRTSDKQRFGLNEEEGLIRANQGHSVEVDLKLEVQSPPELLYHGTATRFMGSIRKQGLLKRGRHHVHLSSDAETARRVGGRKGVPVVLVVQARRMEADGCQFLCSQNGVWLVDEVPPAYFSLWKDRGR